MVCPLGQIATFSVNAAFLAQTAPFLFHEFGIHSGDVHAAWVGTGRHRIEAIQESPQNAIRFSTLQNSCQPKNTEMTSATESFRIAFRVSDKQFVVRDATDTDVFAGTYRDVESWLDQRENTVSALRAEETMGESETDAAAAVLKATMLTQEMIDKALAPDAEPAPEPVAETEVKTPSFRSRLFGRKQKVK